MNETQYEREIRETYSRMAEEYGFEIDILGETESYLTNDNLLTIFRVEYRDEYKAFDVNLKGDFECLTKGLEGLIEVNKTTQQLLDLNEKLSRTGFPTYSENYEEKISIFDLCYSAIAKSPTDVNELSKFLGVIRDYLDEQKSGGMKNE